MKKPRTLQQAIIYFGNLENCFDFMVQRRWPNGVSCPTCGREDVRFISTRKMWECKNDHARRQFSVKVGTIFEDSALGLDKWLTAIWMIANCKNGVSSYEIGRALGITQKSAWFMLHRIRLAMQSNSFMKIGGFGKEVEADETFIGGKARNMHMEARKRRITGHGAKDKDAVLGVLERGGEVRTMHVPNVKSFRLHSEIKRHVEAGSALYTDELASYQGLDAMYARGVIDHATAYVDGRIHTNGLENYWSLLKRTISGTYVSVEPFHLFRYLDEQAFRYNNRKKPMDDGDRFMLLTSHLLGKRLTYAELTGKSGPVDFATHPFLN